MNGRELRTRTLPPPTIGQLVGLNAAGRVTGDYRERDALIAQLHGEGFSNTEIGRVLGVSARAVAAMVRDGQKTRAAG